MRQKTYLSPDEQWLRSVEFYESKWGSGPISGLVRVRQPHRLFLRGDVLFVAFWNGGAERVAVCGVSSKGRAVDCLFMNYQKFDRKTKQPYQHGPIELLELPVHLEDHDPDSPAIRQFVASLRTGN